MMQGTLDTLLYINVRQEGQKKPIILRIPIKDGDAYTIGRDPTKSLWEKNVSIYNALTGEKIFDIPIQNMFISRYNPNIGKYGSIYITMYEGKLNVFPAPNTKNIPKIVKTGQNVYEITIGPTKFKIFISKLSS